jgi:ATP-dependent DNA helicase DinG
MIGECAKTLLGEYGGARIIVAEGPTGTGKTLAYLLSAIPVAKAAGHKVVLSSATVALQEQLVERDIPAMQQHSGIEFTYAVAKGRGRYACKSNLELLSGNHPDQGSLFDGEELGVWRYRPEDEDLRKLYGMFDAYSDGSWDGCRDTLPEPVSEELWSQVTSDSHSCPGKLCRNFRQCAFVRARWQLGEVDVIVANHDLVLAYLPLETEAVLPLPENTVYVFDEAHHLPRKSLAHFSAATSLQNMKDHADRLNKVLPKMALALPEGAIGPQDLDTAHGLSSDLDEALEHVRQMASGLPYGQETAGNATYRAPLGEIPEPLREASDEIMVITHSMARLVGGLKEKLVKAVEKNTVSQQVAETIYPELGFLSSRLEKAHALWTLMAERDHPRQPPAARWIVRTEKDYRIEASPISAAGALRSLLWSRCAGAVVTSATLRSVGTFDRIRAKMGLRKDDGTQFCAIPSPFDYAANGMVYVPWMNADGSRPDAHTAEVARLLPNLLQNNVSGLVLFSSWRQMREVYAALPAKLRKAVLQQGDMAKSALMEEHARRVTKGRSFIFGVDSMAEGVDLRGKLCEHVIIVKLPFTVPDSPIEATQAEWLESIGHNPFMQLAVPEASLKLIQAAGRLLRTETDRGQVTILDRRIVTKRYGGLLLDSLPPFRRVIEERPVRVVNG